MKSLNLDYIFGIHYPYIISNEVLNIPKVGVLNLHPAFLPYNKGWHTPSWAILDKTRYGATLHFMTEKLDEGDIVRQKELQVQQHDTANSLYERVLQTEFEVFEESFQDLVNLTPRRIKQEHIGTKYAKKDLDKVARLDLNEHVKTGDLIDKLRALTTNKIEESAYFEKDGKKHYIQISITE